MDDHTRYKSVHLLRNKDEAPAAVRKFLAEFTAALNRNSSRGSKLVGTLHSDNAGEFLSSEFAAFLQTRGMNSTTCPPPRAPIERRR
eukprot:674794-Pleurochrysis_carterae.AAC.1